MTEHDPPRLRELEPQDSELNDLLDAAERDVLPRDVLSRSAARLSATVGLSVADLTGLGTSPLDAASAALSAKGTATAAAGSAAAKGAATATTAASAAAVTGKSVAMLAPALGAAAKPLLVVVLASATTVAVWRAQPEPHAAPARAPVSAPAPITVPAVSKRAHPNIDPYVLPVEPIVEPTPAVPAHEKPAAQRSVAPHGERREVARSQQETRAIEGVGSLSAAAEELRSLQVAQAELATNPRGAVQRLRAHAATWPRGWLDEERAALLVEALLRTGDRTQAERALRELEAHKPRAPALPRLRRMLEQDEEP